MILRLLLLLAACELGGCGMPGSGEVPPAPCTDDDACLVLPRLSCQRGTCVLPSCPAGSVYVRGGTYNRGCNADEPDCDVSAQPAHQVKLSHGVCLSVTELTVGEYRACVSDGHCPVPAPPESLSSLRCSTDLATWTDAAGTNEDLPMSCLLWAEAEAACAAAAGRLPTEAEWERAARGSDGRSFPWGRSTPLFCDQGINFAGASCPGRPWPATLADRQGSMLRSPFGLYDQAGNISEWVADYFAVDAYAACQAGCTDPSGPQAPSSGALRSRRGGSFGSRSLELRSYARDFHPATGPRSDLIGVRCAFAPLNP